MYYFIILFLEIFAFSHINCMELTKDEFSKKILKMVPFHIHHEAECLDALTFAFNQIGKIKELDSLIEEGESNRSLAKIKDLWDTYTELECLDGALVPIDDSHPAPTLKNRQEYASNILLAALKLRDEEKNKSIHRLRSHRKILCSLASIITTAGFLTNFFMYYYGICNKN